MLLLNFEFISSWRIAYLEGQFAGGHTAVLEREVSLVEPPDHSYQGLKPGSSVVINANAWFRYNGPHQYGATNIHLQHLVVIGALYHI